MLEAMQKRLRKGNVLKTADDGNRRRACPVRIACIPQVESWVLFAVTFNLELATIFHSSAHHTDPLLTSKPPRLVVVSDTLSPRQCPGKTMDCPRRLRARTPQGAAICWGRGIFLREASQRRVVWAAEFGLWYGEEVGRSRGVCAEVSWRGTAAVLVAEARG